MNTEIEKKDTVEYPFELNLGNKTIKFRKWRVKDRKAFLKVIEDIENISEEEASNVLVYNCVDGDYTFSNEEFRYVLTEIRSKSISTEFKFEYTCVNCEHENIKILKLEDVVKFKPSEYKTILIDDIKIEIGDIPNLEKYKEDIASCTNADEVYFTDFIYHISMLNDDDTKSFDDIQDFLEDLDVDIMDEILEQWSSQKAQINDIVELHCDECKNKEWYSFDEIPEFFPITWFKR